ncbi:hypothetical protein [Bacteroides salyersiae]|jgi:hypothetical protein|uniref:hypothetical protein n=1 Tax=Bacteroides salyersiae TaxID=291644 RepID=UPI001C8B365E|nr:hypothetical protein [Bacteroides salyersiae]
MRLHINTQTKNRAEIDGKSCVHDLSTINNLFTDAIRQQKYRPSLTMQNNTNHAKTDSKSSNKQYLIGEIRI